MNSFYTEKELEQLNLKYFGKNVLISKKCSIYGAEKISIADNVRIDDFCILSGNITIGSNIHIAAYSALYAGDVGIELKDYSGLSSRCSLYAISDDYSGNYLIGPCVPPESRNVECGKIILEKYSIIGSTSVILPGVKIGEGCAVGSMSLVRKSTEDWFIYCGTPAKKLKPRSKNMINLIK